MVMHGYQLHRSHSLVIGLLLAVASAACTAGPPARSAPASASGRIAECRVLFADSLSLASEQTGVVAGVLAPGAVVRAGGDVARLRDGVLQAKRAIIAKEASNDVEVRYARKSAELARLKHQRAIEANTTQTGTVSELELREMLLAAQKAELQQEQAEHTLAIARLRLAEIDAQLQVLRLQAPSTMFVRAVHRKPGEVVRQGDVIAEVIDISRVRIEGHAPLAVARHLQVGKQVEIEIGSADPAAGDAQRFVGAITFIDVKIEPVSQRIRFAVEVPNPTGQLREGMQATVLVSTQRTSQRTRQTAKRENQGDSKNVRLAAMESQNHP